MARVLVIDDQPDSAEILAILLSRHGHLVVPLTEPERAVEVALAHCPDVVFCDLSMPGMDGFQVARALRAIPQLRSLVLIAQTAFSADYAGANAKAAGFDRYFVKPLPFREIRLLLREIDEKRARDKGLDGQEPGRHASESKNEDWP